MYNLTDDQKELAKWLVQSVRAGNLREEFYIYWCPIRKGHPQIRLSAYQGKEEDLQNVTLASVNVLAENKLLIYKVIQSHQYLAFKPVYKPPLEEVWDCILLGNIYNAVDNNFKSPDTPKPPNYKQNPWISGSFYLVALVVVSAAFAVISAYIPWYIIPILLIAAIIALGVIGAFQLRMDGELNESNFLTLMIETYKRLPLLIQDKTKPPSEK